MKQHVPDDRLNNERQDHHTFPGIIHALTFGENEACRAGSVTRDSNKEELAAAHS
jgi:hypothetical protein